MKGTIEVKALEESPVSMDSLLAYRLEEEKKKVKKLKKKLKSPWEGHLTRYSTSLVRARGFRGVGMVHEKN